MITEIHIRSRRTYGWRRIRAELADAYGQTVNKKLIQAIMGELAISGPAGTAQVQAQRAPSSHHRRAGEP